MKKYIPHFRRSELYPEWGRSPEGEEGVQYYHVRERIPHKLARIRRTLIRSALAPHAHLFVVEPPSQTCTGRSPLASRRRRSECRGRDVKCVGNAPFSSRSGRIASGITWRRRRGAVLGSPHARAPKVSPKMVGPLLRGNDFGGNPQEGGTILPCHGDVDPLN